MPVEKEARLGSPPGATETASDNRGSVRRGNGTEVWRRGKLSDRNSNNIGVRTFVLGDSPIKLMAYGHHLSFENCNRTRLRRKFDALSRAGLRRLVARTRLRSGEGDVGVDGVHRLAAIWLSCAAGFYGLWWERSFRAGASAERARRQAQGCAPIQRPVVGHQLPDVEEVTRVLAVESRHDLSRIQVGK